MKADLHIHSCYSNDGERSVPDIIEMCIETGTGLFSITDHNGIKGAREAARLCAAENELSFIPGIEIDCNYQGTDLHLLGYQIDLMDPDFEKLEQKIEHLYLEAAPMMVQNLGKLGIEIDLEELMLRAEGKPPTGELIAEVLLENPDHHTHLRLKPYLPGGHRSDMPLINFYLDFMAQGKPAHVEINHIDFKDALELVRSNGGIPVVAHPGLNLKGKEQVATELLDQGAMGLEVFNNYHSGEQTAYFAALTKKCGAWMTCGSDFHGKTKPLISIGQYRLKEEYRDYLHQSLEELLNFSF